MDGGACANVDHLIVGGGKFGLGFAGELAQRAGWRTAVLFRDGCTKRSQEHFELLSRDSGYDIEFFDDTRTSVDAVPIQTSFASLSDSARSVFASRDLKLVSVAVPDSPEAILNAGSLLAQGLKARSEVLSGESGGITVLACMNNERNGPLLQRATRDACAQQFGDDELVRALLSHSSFPLCVVDRICSDISVADRGSGARLQVSAERYACLVVPAPLLAGLSELDERCPGVVVAVPGDDPAVALRAWQYAKYWGVNGLHLFLAAVVRESRPEDTSAHIAGRLDADRQLEALARLYVQEVVAALTIRYPGHPSADALRVYLFGTVERFKASPDPVERLLRDLRSQSRGQGWRDQLIALDDRLRSLYGDRSSEDDFARREEDLLQAMSAFVDFSVGTFLSKVHARVLEPARVIQDVGLIPVTLSHAANQILAVVARELARRERNA